MVPGRHRHNGTTHRCEILPRREDAAGHKSQAGGTRSLATPNAQRTTHTSRRRTPGAVNQRVERQTHHERSSKQIASKSPAHTRTRQ